MRIYPQKRLGQNFLIDANIRNKIIASLGLKPADTVLEIGAGRGELTDLISRRVKNVYAVEIDRRLAALLNDSFAGSKNVKIIEGDILKYDLEKLFAQDRISGRVKVFGNIPYYISSPIIERLIQCRMRISEVFITVQKEFARRITSPPGSKEYGSLSCFVQYYALPKIIFPVKRGCFYPVPKVDSCLLYLRFREKPAVSVRDEDLFFKLIRAAFGQRRKTLRNSLRDKVSSGKLESFFFKNKLGPNVRPEELSLNDFAFLANL